VNGFQSSEFALTVAKIIVSILVLVGVISTTNADNVTGPLAVGLTALGVVVANAVVVWSYVHHRTALKPATVNAQAAQTVAASAATIEATKPTAPAQTTVNTGPVAEIREGPSNG